MFGKNVTFWGHFGVPPPPPQAEQSGTQKLFFVGIILLPLAPKICEETLFLGQDVGLLPSAAREESLHHGHGCVRVSVQIENQSVLALMDN